MTENQTNRARQPQGRRRAVVPKVDKPASFAFGMLLIYSVSFLLHVPERIPAIAVIRPDLLILVALAFSLIASDWSRVTESKPGRLLLLLIAWVVLTIPFVEWPGSVVRFDWKPLAKAIIFFFAIALTVTTVKRLKVFLTVFLGCQVIRVLEPLYMHIVDGYWGDKAHLSDGEFMNRLSGAPSDVINPNGLAFVIVVLLPFLHVLLFHSNNKKQKFLYLMLLVPLGYALLLTGSRSGLVGIAMVLIGLIWFSKRRMVMVALCALLAIGFVSQMDDHQRDRYLSIVSSQTLNAATAEGRIRGWSADFQTAMGNPVFGHGVATSKEALANSGRGAQVSHNMYMEVLIELGIPGAIIFLSFLFSSGQLVVKNLGNQTGKISLGSKDPEVLFIDRLAQTFAVSYFAWLVFHLAQYGLTQHEWYVLTGLSLSLFLLNKKKEQPGRVRNRRV